MKKYILIIVLLVLPNICFADGPSFDCKKASTCIEKLICADKELSMLDKKMSEAYSSLFSKLQGNDEAQVKQSQTRWIKARDERCEEPDIRKDEAQKMVEKAHFQNLYSHLYTERIEELQEWGKYIDGEKTAKFSPWQTNCWKRKELVSKQFWPVTGNASVCRTFEQVLNTTCEPPEKLKCNWTLPPGEKRFKKLKWQPLDWREYWGLIEDMVKSGVGAHIRGELWKKEEANVSKEANEVRRLLAKNTIDEATLRKGFEEGHRSLAITTVDIDHDGHPEQVVRMDRVPLPGTTFGVMIPETKRLDWRYEAKLLEINAGNESGEIMIYEGTVYQFGLERGSGIIFVWDFNRGNACQFKHLKGGKKK